MPRKSPSPESPWTQESLAVALSAANPASLKNADIMQLSEAVRHHLPKALRHIAWGQGVYATRNFIETIVERTPAPALSDFLRPLDAALEFPSGELLLLSELEADRLLPIFWSLEQTSPSKVGKLVGPRSVNLCYCRSDTTTLHLKASV